mmetsp:Transcript_470/g.1813  ORF Transcript_470/g.1813 Transcript_470/m.1813 type:complete len:290 (-) Transcript_470:69-938(-)
MAVRVHGVRRAGSYVGGRGLRAVTRGGEETKASQKTFYGNARGDDRDKKRGSHRVARRGPSNAAVASRPARRARVVPRVRELRFLPAPVLATGVHVTRPGVHTGRLRPRRRRALVRVRGGEFLLREGSGRRHRKRRRAMASAPRRHARRDTRAVRLAFLSGASQQTGVPRRFRIRHRARRRAGGMHPGHAGGGHRGLPRVPAGCRAGARRGVPRRHKHARRLCRHRRKRRDGRDSAKDGRVRPRVRRHRAGVPQQRAGVGEEHARETSVPGVGRDASRQSRERASEAID